MPSFTVVVAEVTQPSLGVGYEIGRAVTMKKKILCLYRPQKDKCMKLHFENVLGLFTVGLLFSVLSGMIRGIPEDQARVVDYKEEEVDEVFKSFFI